MKLNATVENDPRNRQIMTMLKTKGIRLHCQAWIVNQGGEQFNSFLLSKCPDEASRSQFLDNFLAAITAEEVFDSPGGTNLEDLPKGHVLTKTLEEILGKLPMDAPPVLTPETTSDPIMNTGCNEDNEEDCRADLAQRLEEEKGVPPSPIPPTQEEKEVTIKKHYDDRAAIDALGAGTVDPLDASQPCPTPIDARPEAHMQIPVNDPVDEQSLEGFREHLKKYSTMVVEMEQKLVQVNDILGEIQEHQAKVVLDIGKFGDTFQLADKKFEDYRKAVAEDINGILGRIDANEGPHHLDIVAITAAIMEEVHKTCITKKDLENLIK